LFLFFRSHSLQVVSVGPKKPAVIVPEREYSPGHFVQVTPGSKLHQITQVKEFQTTALHHQAIGNPGKGVNVVGKTPDGVVEAIELDRKLISRLGGISSRDRFFLGVQFHPEAMSIQGDEPSRKIFNAFGEAVRQSSLGTAFNPLWP
jgi:putative glutamine amidotransferase